MAVGQASRAALVAVACCTLLLWPRYDPAAARVFWVPKKAPGGGGRGWYPRPPPSPQNPDAKPWPRPSRSGGPQPSHALASHAATSLLSQLTALSHSACLSNSPRPLPPPPIGLLVLWWVNLPPYPKIRRPLFRDPRFHRNTLSTGWCIDPTALNAIVPLSPLIPWLPLWVSSPSTLLGDSIPNQPFPYTIFEPPPKVHFFIGFCLNPWNCHVNHTSSQQFLHFYPCFSTHMMGLKKIGYLGHMSSGLPTIVTRGIFGTVCS